MFAEAASAQDLCSTGKILFDKTEGNLIVSFLSYFPIELRTSEHCIVRGKCNYDVAMILADRTDVQYEGLEIIDLCSVASERRGEFEKHGVSEYSGPLTKVFEFSRTSAVTITTASGSFSVSRTDYAPTSDTLGWTVPFLENGGSVLIASPLTSTFELTIHIEE